MTSDPDAARAAGPSPIGIFDSGVGGLSVLREIRRALPSEDLLYAADSAYAPYGDRDPDVIQARALAVVRWLESRGAKAVVVACNTATGVAVDLLRERVALPIVAIEPAVKPAAALTRTGTVGVMATTRTLASPRFARLVSAHAQGVRIVTQACPGLVQLVEAGELASDDARALVAQYVGPLLQQGADVIVLGCTHYPFLTPLIAEAAGAQVTIVADGNGSAELNPIFGKSGSVSEIRIMTKSGTPDIFVRVRPPLESPQQLSEYAGTYYSEELDADYILMLEGDKLVLQISEDRKPQLAPAYADVFTAASGEIDLVFARDAKGRITGFVFNSGVDGRDVKGVAFTRQ